MGYRMTTYTHAWITLPNGEDIEVEIMAEVSADDGYGTRGLRLPPEFDVDIQCVRDDETGKSYRLGDLSQEAQDAIFAAVEGV